MKVRDLWRDRGRSAWCENYTGAYCEEAGRKGEVRSRRTDKMGAVIVQTLMKGVKRHIGKMALLCRDCRRVSNRERWYQHVHSLPHPWPLLFQPPPQTPHKEAGLAQTSLPPDLPFYSMLRAVCGAIWASRPRLADNNAPVVSPLPSLGASDSSFCSTGSQH